MDRSATAAGRLVLAILLHGAIVILMGLFSFGLIMIALVLAACADTPAVRRTCIHSRQQTVSARPRKGIPS
jgi:hypothetical protein